MSDAERSLIQYEGKIYREVYVTDQITGHVSDIVVKKESDEILRKVRDEARREATAQAIGWAYADACVHLDKNIDYRKLEAPEILKRALRDLGVEARAKERE